MKTLYLEKRGCDFLPYDKRTEQSDLGNYRICTPGYDVLGKDGNMYHLSFMLRSEFRYRYRNKRTGAMLKKPVRETVYDSAMMTNCSYIDSDGACWGNSPLEIALLDDRRFKYTVVGILDAVNYICGEEVYDRIKFVERT